MSDTLLNPGCDDCYDCDPCDGPGGTCQAPRSTPSGCDATDPFCVDSSSGSLGCHGSVTVDVDLTLTGTKFEQATGPFGTDVISCTPSNCPDLDGTYSVALGSPINEVECELGCTMTNAVGDTYYLYIVNRLQIYLSVTNSPPSGGAGGCVAVLTIEVRAGTILQVNDATPPTEAACLSAVPGNPGNTENLSIRIQHTASGLEVSDWEWEPSSLCLDECNTPVSRCGCQPSGTAFPGGATNHQNDYSSDNRGRCNAAVVSTSAEW